MSDITQQAVNKVVDVADAATDAAVDAVAGVASLGEDAATATLSVAGNTVEDALNEVKVLKQQLSNLLRSIVNTVTEPLP